MWTTEEDEWIECVRCRNLPHEVCSPYNHKFVDYGRKLLQEKNSRGKRVCKKFRSLDFIVLSLFVTNILYLCYIFSFLMFILRHCLEYSSTVFVYLAFFLNAQGIFKERHLSLIKSSISTGTSGKDDAETTCFRRPVSRRLISADILHTA